MIVWGKDLNDKDFYNAIKLQTYLTHSNPIAIEATYLYGNAIKMMINEPHLTGLEVYERTKALSNERMRTTKHENYVEITNWFEGIDRGFLPDARIQMGWLKIAFMYSFYHLKHCDRNNPKAFEDALFEILKLSGDTDTNAAIMGGLLGAHLGLSGIPDSYKEAILKFDCKTMDGNNVADFLLPKHHLCRLLT